MCHRRARSPLQAPRPPRWRQQPHQRAALPPKAISLSCLCEPGCGPDVALVGRVLAGYAIATGWVAERDIQAIPPIDRNHTERQVDQLGLIELGPCLLVYIIRHTMG